jgi:uncharacterized delta-60 repeat protein
MKNKHILFATTTALLLSACGEQTPTPITTVVSGNTGKPTITTPQPGQTNPNSKAKLGLLEIHIEGIGPGATPTASARFVQNIATPGKNGQLGAKSIDVLPVKGLNALDDIEFERRNVSFLDDDPAGVRYVLSSFNLTNRTGINFDNLSLYAVSVPNQTIGGTSIASMYDATGTAITDAARARGFTPTHPMQASIRAPRVNFEIAGLQYYTPAEITGLQTDAVAANIITAASSVLEYGFIASNLDGGRAIAARDTATDCTIDACKGVISLAYKLPKGPVRSANPYSFNLYFVVANDTDAIVSQSKEEQPNGSVSGTAGSVFDTFKAVRTVAGSNLTDLGNLDPLCRVKIATPTTGFTESVYLGAPITPATAGGLDVCFGGGGTRLTSIGNNSSLASDVAVQGTKLIVVGSSDNGTDNDFAVVRYLPNGALDLSFGTNGKVVTPIGSSNDEARAVAVQPDNKIVVVGSAENGGALDFAVVRYDANGALDNTFGPGGTGKIVTTVGTPQHWSFNPAVRSSSPAQAPTDSTPTSQPPDTRAAVHLTWLDLAAVRALSSPTSTAPTRRSAGWPCRGAASSWSARPAPQPAVRWPCNDSNQTATRTSVSARTTPASN